MFAMLFNDKPANSLLYTREEGLIRVFKWCEI